MDEWIKRFQNHTLQFKMMVLISSILIIILTIAGTTLGWIVARQFNSDLKKSYQTSVKQMTITANRAMFDIVQQMVIFRDDILLPEISVNESEKKSYSNQSIIYQNRFNKLLAEDNNSQFIHSMIVADHSEETFSYAVDGRYKVNSDKLFEKISTVVDNSDNCWWSGILDATYYFNAGQSEVISIIMPVSNYRVVKKYLIVNLKVEAVVDYLKQIVDNPHMCFLVTDDNEICNLSKENREKTSLDKQEKIEKAILNGYESEGQEYTFIREKFEINKWQLVMVVSNAIPNNVQVLIQSIGLILVTVVIILFICLYFIVVIVTKPIKKMTQVIISNSNTRDMKYRFHVKYQDEVGVLASSYNNMMDEIEHLMKSIELEQIEKRKTLFRMMQMQIKPHFLYNTLETAKFMIETKNPQSIAMLDAIGKFYRLSLSGINEIIPLREEVEQLKYYLTIMKLRYPSKYDYSIEIEEGIKNCEMIKFTLQPLVENAIYHGIKQKKQKGFVKLIGYQEENDVILVVWDNGIGMTMQELECINKLMDEDSQIKQIEHVGIVNVNQRIRLQYGEKYGIKITGLKNVYTRVEIRIPKQSYVVRKEYQEE